MLWETPYSENLVSLAGLTDDEAAIWAGVAEEACSATQVMIRHVKYRTESSEKFLRTSDSGLSATFQVGDANVKHFGNIQAILEVTYGGKQFILLDVRWFSQSLENKSLRGTFWVKRSGRDVYLGAEEGLICAHHVDGQVFFASDPDGEGYAHVFSYSGSSALPPEHHFADDGTLIEF